VLELLRTRGLTLAVAEGDTGGLLLERLTSTPGSSATMLGGVVAYHDDLKRDLLGVPAEMLREHGAVSSEVALAMAAGVRKLVAADVGVATTGIAGPGGATPSKPVGLAFVAVVDEAGSLVREYRWQGDRAHNRAASVEAAIELVKEHLENSDNPRTPVLHSRSEAKRGKHG
jgi:PncC family amidohydrolase